MPHKDTDTRRAYMREYRRAWKKRHRDRLLAEKREWRKTPAGQAATARDNARLAEYNRSAPERRRGYRLKAQYGMTLDDYDRMFAEQGGLCAICRKGGHTKKPLCVDHCHTSGRVRSLLCVKCNMALGGVDENLDIVAALAAYIRQWELA